MCSGSEAASGWRNLNILNKRKRKKLPYDNYGSFFGPSQFYYSLTSSGDEDLCKSWISGRSSISVVQNPSAVQLRELDQIVQHLSADSCERIQAQTCLPSFSGEFFWVGVKNRMCTKYLNV